MSIPRAQEAMPDLSLALPREDSQARHLREQIRIWAATVGIGERQLDDVLLVASELLSNAVRASDVGSSISVNFANSTLGVTVHMENTGPGFDIESLPLPSRQRHGGRGIAIMRALGTVAVIQEGTQTLVTAVIRPPR
jgi:anti-sigma regulatory factor (Ser/Thr protein kinase)